MHTVSKISVVLMEIENLLITSTALQKECSPKQLTDAQKSASKYLKRDCKNGVL